MRYVRRRHWLLFLYPCVAVSQEIDVAPTRLEAFVADPFVVVEREQQIGELGSLDSAVRIHAIEANDRSNPGNLVRGVRIGLSNNAWRDTVYLDQEQFTELGRQLRMMHDMLQANEDESSPFYNPRQNAGRRTMGSEICWMPEVPQRILCPSQHFIEGRESFTLRVYGSQESFPLNPDQLVVLSRVVDSAIEQLESDALFIEDPTLLENRAADSDRNDVAVSLSQAETTDRSQEEASTISQSLASPPPAESIEASASTLRLAIAVIALFSGIAIATMIISRRSRRPE